VAMRAEETETATALRLRERAAREHVASSAAIKNVAAVSEKKRPVDAGAAASSAPVRTTRGSMSSSSAVALVSPASDAAKPPLASSSARDKRKLDNAVDPSPRKTLTKDEVDVKAATHAKPPLASSSAREKRKLDNASDPALETLENHLDTRKSSKPRKKDKVADVFLGNDWNQIKKVYFHQSGFQNFHTGMAGTNPPEDCGEHPAHDTSRWCLHFEKGWYNCLFVGTLAEKKPPNGTKLIKYKGFRPQVDTICTANDTVSRSAALSPTRSRFPEYPEPRSHARSLSFSAMPSHPPARVFGVVQNLARTLASK
jgi:hypothetical protein